MTERDELHQRVAGILGEAFGGAVRVGDGVTISDRDHVWRIPILDGPSGAPASVIAKRPRLWGDIYDPDSDDLHNPAQGLLAEWHGLAFLGSLAVPPFTPRLYGGDRQYGLVVLEDLGSGTRFDEALLGSDAQEAETALLDLAAVLGRMHALTIGRYEQFTALGAQIGRSQADLELNQGTLQRVLPAALDLFDLPAPAGLDTDLARLAETLQNPGSFHAYTHGDPCPDNWLRVEGQPYLLDFERGAFRHALLDGVYGRIHFPTCWCVNRIPREVVQRVEHTYRTALAATCPAAADNTQFGQAVAAACSYWVLDLLNWAIERPSWYEPPQPLKRAGHWGIATIQQRMLVRADLLAHTMAEYPYFEAISQAVEQIATLLRAHWPAAAGEMPLYPAFRPAGS